MTDIELALRQAEVLFEEEYDEATGNKVVGFKAYIAIEQVDRGEVRGGRIRTREDLRRLMRSVADKIWRDVR